MMSYLKDKSIVITGAGGGFGALLARKCLQRGAKVTAIDLNLEGLQETLPEDPDCQLIAADVTDHRAMKDAAKQACSRYGSIDILVNNAGVMPLAFYQDHEQAIDAWHQCIDVNIKGVLNGIIAAFDIMMAQGQGHVVNLSSIYGNAAVPGSAVYGATKAAVNMLSDALRLESTGKIKVTTVRPTGVPGTGLGQGVLNPEAISGILGSHYPSYLETMMAVMNGTASEDLTSSESIGYAALEPERLVEQILYSIDQPWGVVISDITVRAANDRYVI
ncbi:MAG: SDR family oxidoreductase [Pseudomonadales bacterium]|nr:SDR family oxidoreductase [Pseudomonadales bacterium]MDA0759980.1 SDR family oxidoreductase [Pseudomonadota bacterium]MDA0956389.1 SDR family oxidoreductase [Pseudomonadota bacterium]MDA1206051.1 SDR family oxidoreductase [Pseudomonadota bacterium]